MLHLLVAVYFDIYQFVNTVSGFLEKHWLVRADITGLDGHELT